MLRFWIIVYAVRKGLKTSTATQLLLLLVLQIEIVIVIQLELTTYKLAAFRKVFCVPTCLSVWQTSFASKSGGVMLVYAPGWTLASQFWCYPPPPKTVGSSAVAKKMEIPMHDAISYWMGIRIMKTAVTDNLKFQAKIYACMSIF